MVLRQAQPQHCCWAGGRGQSSQEGAKYVKPRGVCGFNHAGLRWVGGSLGGEGDFSALQG